MARLIAILLSNALDRPLPSTQRGPFQRLRTTWLPPKRRKTTGRGNRSVAEGSVKQVQPILTGYVWVW